MGSNVGLDFAARLWSFLEMVVGQLGEKTAQCFGTGGAHPADFAHFPASRRARPPWPSATGSMRVADDRFVDEGAFSLPAKR